MAKIKQKIAEAVGRLRPLLSADIWCRLWLVYLALFVSFFLVGDYRGAIRSAQLQVLSRMATKFDYYQAFVVAPTPEPKKLEDCIQYHRALADVIENERGQAYSLIAYCSYLSGDKKQAIDMLNQSIDHVPVFFWPYFNRGVYYFNERDFMNASKAFSEATALEPRLSLFVLLKSKVYLDIMLYSESQLAEGDPAVRLIDGYKEARRLATQSLACISEPNAPECQETLKMHFL